MPYVQSERAILYSLHRGAYSRGLQARRERELAPGLCELQCVLLEMLISRGEGACVLQSVVRGLHRCVCYLIRSLGAALVTPFYSRREAQGRYMYLLRGIFCLAEAACSSPAACYFGGMVGGAVLSLVHWSDAPVTPDPV